MRLPLFIIVLHLVSIYFAREHSETPEKSSSGEGITFLHIPSKYENSLRGVADLEEVLRNTDLMRTQDSVTRLFPKDVFIVLLTSWETLSLIKNSDEFIFPPHEQSQIENILSLFGKSPYNALYIGFPASDNTLTSNVIARSDPESLSWTFNGKTVISPQHILGNPNCDQSLKSLVIELISFHEQNPLKNNQVVQDVMLLCGLDLLLGSNTLSDLTPGNIIINILKDYPVAYSKYVTETLNYMVRRVSDASGEDLLVLGICSDAFVANRDLSLLSFVEAKTNRICTFKLEKIRCFKEFDNIDDLLRSINEIFSLRPKVVFGDEFLNSRRVVRSASSDGENPFNIQQGRSQQDTNNLVTLFAGAVLVLLCIIASISLLFSIDSSSGSSLYRYQNLKQKTE